MSRKSYPRPRRTHDPLGTRWTWTLPGIGRLVMWNTYERFETGQSKLGYCFYLPRTRVNPLFHGNDFGCPPHLCHDSLHAALLLMGFLTLRPGDTDDDYFADYTKSQRAWAESSECEQAQYQIAAWDE